MSLEAMVWAMQQPFDDAGEKLLLLSLANYADAKGVCWPGYEKLKFDAVIKSDATISKKLKAMEERGLITRQRRPKKEGGSTSNLYQLSLGEFCPLSPKKPKLQILKNPETSKAETSIFESETSNIEDSFYLDTSQYRTSQYIYTDEFNFWWSNYPKRQGDQGNKKKTFQRYTKLLSEGFSDQELQEAAIRYRRFCERTGKLNSEFVKQTTTFLNDTANIENRWTVSHENNRSANQGSVSKSEAYAELIFSAPGCESLSAEEQASIFGERPVQDHAAEMANEVQEYVPAEHDGGREE